MKPKSVEKSIQQFLFIFIIFGCVWAGLSAPALIGKAFFYTLAVVMTVALIKEMLSPNEE